MLAAGVDMIEVKRVADVLERHGHRFADRVFTAGEMAYCDGQPERLAGRFAVKEAVAKALGTGIGDITWSEIEIIRDERGKPHLVLHAAAQELAAAQGITEWAISISHTATHAIGFAIGQ